MRLMVMRSTVDRETVRQKKTGQPVKFEMTEQTREAIDNYVAIAQKQPSEFLFSGRRGRDRPITTRQHAASKPVDCRHRFGPEVVRDALTSPNQSDPHLSPDRQPARSTASVGAQEEIESTVCYLGIEVDDALAIAEQVDV